MQTTTSLPTSLKKIDFLEVYNIWQQLARRYDCFVHSTSFATLKNYHDFNLSKVSTEISSPIQGAVSFVKQHCDCHTLFFIDLPIAASLKYAYFLNKEIGILPVLTVRHLSHPYGLVGNEESINALLGYAEVMSDVDSDSPSYLFILDSGRYSSFADDVYKIQFNNQYELTEYDLPPIEMMRENGIRKAVFLFDKSLKEDIVNYKDYLAENHFEVRCFDTSINGEINTNEQ